MLQPESSNPKLKSLEDWLVHLERVHPRSIEMGLERVGRVRAAMRLDPAFPVIAVGGTNGKGSVCAMLEAILSEAGYRAGCYTSPHLLRYNERVRVARRDAADAELCRAFEEVEGARGDVSLTYFEFGTLAAVRLFADAAVDVAILEVGLGGRLDAVNAFDNDCAVVTCVDIDHVDYLGNTREAIGFEKAGIFRAGRAAVCADPDPPQSVSRRADEVGARLLQLGRDFGCAGDRLQWNYWGAGGRRGSLPLPALRGAFQLRNAAAALAVLDEFRERLPVTMRDVRQGLLGVELAGRFQVLPGRPTVVLDVAHNPHAARGLAGNLAALGRSRRSLAVFAMLRDKDIAGVVRALKDGFDAWLVADIAHPRGASAADIAAVLRAEGVAGEVIEFESPSQAYARACEIAGQDDKICVFGSFFTVADVLGRLAAARRNGRP
ncbi:MAG TPA: bifunctional tetrahydrofolate synthase/dihydrofolate synthase [Burkholderiales bacterium]